MHLYQASLARIEDVSRFADLLGPAWTDLQDSLSSQQEIPVEGAKTITAPAGQPPSHDPGDYFFNRSVRRWAAETLHDVDPSLAGLAGEDALSLLGIDPLQNSISRSVAFDEAQSARRELLAAICPIKNSRLQNIFDWDEIREMLVALGFPPQYFGDFFAPKAVVPYQALKALAADISEFEECAQLRSYLQMFMGECREKVRDAYTKRRRCTDAQLDSFLMDSFIGVNDLTEFLARKLIRTQKSRLSSLDAQERDVLFEFYKFNRKVLIDDVRAFLKDDAQFTLFPQMRAAILRKLDASTVKTTGVTYHSR